MPARHEINVTILPINLPIFFLLKHFTPQALKNRKTESLGKEVKKKAQQI